MRFCLPIRRLFDRIYSCVIDADNFYNLHFNDNFVNWLRMNRETYVLMSDCWELADTFDYPDDDKWKPLFIRACRNIGLNKKSALVLWNHIGIENNWEHLLPNDQEMTYTSTQWKEDFIGDLRYCCDRWTFDRLLRVQWRYWQWCNKA